MTVKNIPYVEKEALGGSWESCSVHKNCNKWFWTWVLMLSVKIHTMELRSSHTSAFATKTLGIWLKAKIIIKKLLNVPNLITSSNDIYGLNVISKVYSQTLIKKCLITSPLYLYKCIIYLFTEHCTNI